MNQEMLNQIAAARQRVRALGFTETEQKKLLECIYDQDAIDWLTSENESYLRGWLEAEAESEQLREKIDKGMSPALAYLDYIAIHEKEQAKGRTKRFLTSQNYSN